MSGRTIISGGVAAALVAVCALAMLVLVLLYAFAPDLRGDDTAEANALSRSAIGFAGLRELMTLSGIPAQIDRGPDGRSGETPSLTILTPVIGANANDVATAAAKGPVLIILPKWLAVPQPNNPAWVAKVGIAGAPTIYGPLLRAAGQVSVGHDPGSAHNIATLKGTAAPPGLPTPMLSHIEEIQSVTGANPILIAEHHGTLLAQAKRKGNPIYILADPDLMNNQGLADKTNAREALAIIALLRQGSGPVRMDVTLDGLARTETFLRSLFLPPFLGASLCALIAALLMGLHSWVRFGAPLDAAPVFARGKKALADNSADLVRVMGREGAMAKRYVGSARNLVLDAVAARGAAPAAQDELLAVLERGGDTNYAGLEQEAAEASGGADLLRIARKTYAWRRRITSGYQ